MTKKQRGKIASILAALMIGGCSAEQVTPADAGTYILPENGNIIKEVTDLTVGEIVTFGSYEQDDDSSNGAEKIEWIVMEVEEHRALLLSRYVLDVKSLHETKKQVPWKSCDLRQWLNKDFFNSAFSESEQTLIAETELKNPEFTYISKPQNVDTVDKVFLLSNEELGKLYGDWLELGTHGAYQGFCPDLIVEPTPYARNKGIETFVVDEEFYESISKDYENLSEDVIGREGCAWWYRCNTDGWKTAEYVKPVGRLGTITVYAPKIGVRPAIYVAW